jgi:hypothetical protein
MIKKFSKHKSFLTKAVVMAGIFVCFFFTTLTYLQNVLPAHAANKEDWKAGSIIDDTTFTDANSMSVQEIQSFLDRNIGSCDIWGTSKAVEYNYNGTRAQYAAMKGWASPPYTCLNKYHEVPKTTPGGAMPVNNYSDPSNIPSGAQSAAWIIKDAAIRYNISPKVLLVKIATESAGPLTSDKWPLLSQYKYAMGAQCPDSGPGGSANCNEAYAGFSIQMYEAAGLLRAYLTNMDKPWWSYKKPYQNNNILWNVTQRNCGSSSVYIESKATAALYTYTPYQPNQAALQNMYGTGDNCSAYGNRNFWRVFVDWFGLPSVKPYRWEEVSKTIYTDDTKKTAVDRSSVKQGQYLYVQYKVKNTGTVPWQRGSIKLGTTNDKTSVFSTPDWIGNNRAATLLESEVKPGETGTIEFWVRSPNSPGQYKEYYNLVIDNVSWFVDIGSYWDIKVAGSSARSELNSTTRVLRRGDSITSPDSRTVFSLTPFGSLVIYKDTRVVWSSESSEVYKLILQEDGNLVAYTSYGAAVWVLNGIQTSKLSLTNTDLRFTNGNGGIIWSTASGDANQPAPDHLSTNSLLHRGQTIWSNNGQYRLTLQDDGNLVQYGPSGVLWATNIPQAFYLAQQDDGNLVAYNTYGSAIWASHRSGAYVRTFIQNDGNIVSYGDKGAVWAAR